jgi:hypothetical protein
MSRLSKKFNYLTPVKISKLIRLGNNKDGGYVVSKLAVKKTDTLISLGLGDNFTFEKDFLYHKKKANIYVYDHTVNYFFFYKKIFKTLKRIFYFKANIFDLINKVINLFEYYFFFKDNIRHLKFEIVSKILESRQTNLKDIFNKIESKNVILSIDIEGGEYKIIKDLVGFKERINLVVIEFHNTFVQRKQFKRLIFLLKRYFNIIHIHGNNHEPIATDGLPIVLELTFLNKKKFIINNKNFKKKFPINQLDYPNVPLTKDYRLNFY